MDFSVTTRTPLWAASAEKGRQDRLHETGIIGSLRWWYEAILRGLGASVCSTADRCQRDDQHVPCEACHLFGCTGHRRRFRMTFGNGLPLYVDKDPRLKLDSIPLPSGRIKGPPDKRFSGGWFLYRDSWIGSLQSPLMMRITPLALNAQEKVLRVPLALISRHASFGAKVSNGYGVVDILENGAPLAVDQALVEGLSTGKSTAAEFPNLRDFFFAKVIFQEPSDDANWWQDIKGIAEALMGQVTQNGETANVFDRRNESRNPLLRNEAHSQLTDLVKGGLLPLAPAVRNWMRFEWPDRPKTRGQENFLFGTAQPVCPDCYWPTQQGYCRRCNRQFNRQFSEAKIIERAASKIQVSHAYKLDPKRNEWEFRIWGWIPSELPIKLGEGKTGTQFREDFLDKLGKALQNPGASGWGQATSIPDPAVVDGRIIRCSGTDSLSYLKQLLGSSQEESQ
jgi:CRISPR-associated protein Cmr1